MKLKLDDDIKYVWRYSTYVIQYIAASFLAAWVLISPQQQEAVLNLFGMTGEQLAALSTTLLIVATMTARATRLEFKPPVYGEDE